MKTEHFKSFSIVRNEIEIEVNLDRLSQQFQDAQFWLDTQIMNDMIKFMPMQTGTFINTTRAASVSLAGTGRVVAGVPPQGRFLWEGVKMVNAETGKGPRKISTGLGEFVWRWPKGAKLVPTAIPLNFNTSANPQAQPKWFEAAKAAHGKEWVDGVKERAGGND